MEANRVRTSERTAGTESSPSKRERTADRCFLEEWLLIAKAIACELSDACRRPALCT